MFKTLRNAMLALTLVALPTTHLAGANKPAPDSKKGDAKAPTDPKKTEPKTPPETRVLPPT